MTALLDVLAAGAARPAFTPRAVILDLDGTVLDHTPRLHPRVRDTVRRVAQRVPVIIATGRMYRSALPWARDLGVVEPLVCYDGAMVRTMPAPGDDIGTVVQSLPLRREPAIHALRIARQHDWYYQAYPDEQLLCEQLRPEADLYALIAGVPVRPVGDLEPFLDAGTPKALCVIPDPGEAQLCVSVMRAELGSTARITQSRSEYIEIIDPAVSKAAACATVCARLGFTLAECAAVGDAPNDIELLEAAGFAAAVDSAAPAVRAHADVLCAPPEGAGVADVLDALIPT